ncbi:MAG: hypothetical protein ABW157_20390 [Candidatus Thiodiazotropha sp. LLP2]
MNTIYKTLVVTTFSFLVATPVFADYSGKHRYCDYDRETSVERRLDRQQHRIDAGVNRDSLTYKETKKLKKKHRNIRRLSREYQEDGHLSRKEYKRLNRKLDRLSELIREYKHNDLVRYVRYHDNYAQTDNYVSKWR